MVLGNLVGSGPAWTVTLRQIVEIALFTAAAVLITGESGTGKELVARLLHTLDRRPRKGDLVVLDCTTIVPELAGSEFFGHERGAFTNAVAPRDGAFALADNGTLFLDEIGELPLPLQADLLRVVQDAPYKRAGATPGTEPSSAWSARPIGTCSTRSREAASDATSITGSPAASASSRRCASEWRTCCR